MAYFSDEPAIAEYIKDFRFFYKGEWRSMLKRPDSRPEGMTAYEMRFDDPSNPPADDRTPPADNGWHFAHLGRDYFERKVQACAQHGISDIAAIWLGISGVAPYALSKHPRPNWAVEDSLGKCKTVNSSGVLQDPFKAGRARGHMRRWPYQEIEEWFGLRTTGADHVTQ